MRQSLIAGNWKMNGSHESVDHLLKSIKARILEVTHVELALFPPYVFLERAANVLADTPITWGAQNLSEKANGAFTGEISSIMLSEFGCRYVIVGHSERRTLYHEDNARVAAKFMAAMAAGLRPILCLGESLEQRESGKTLEIISEQLDAVLSLVDNQAALAHAVIAYEPVWAIGTGQQATPAQAQAVHEAIRAQCRAKDTQLSDKMRIIYGGSVKPETAAGLFDMPDIDGALVGGASLHADQFIDIALAAHRGSSE